jgi:hypothetical protein
MIENLSSTYDDKLAKRTFRSLKNLGIGIPLNGYRFGMPPFLPQEEQDKIRDLQSEHHKFGEKTRSVRKKSKAKGTGLGLKAAALLRALDARGFDISDYNFVRKGDYHIAFSRDEWSLSNGDEILHTQPYGAGSVGIVDNIMVRRGG